MISLPNIISFIIYLVIGAAVVIALMVIFRKMGIAEEEASPARQWEKAVEAYGDPAIINLYQNAASDEERAEIAAFVNGELAKMNGGGQEEEPILPEEPVEEDTLGATTVIPDLQRIGLEDMAEQKAAEEPDTVIWQNETEQSGEGAAAEDIATEAAAAQEVPADVEEAAAEVPPAEEAAAAANAVATEVTRRKEGVDLDSIMNAPAYNFWQEEVVVDQLKTDSLRDDVCRECGAKLEPNATFCVICGTRVQKDAPAPEEDHAADPMEAAYIAAAPAEDAEESAENTQDIPNDAAETPAADFAAETAAVPDEAGEIMAATATEAAAEAEDIPAEEPDVFAAKDDRKKLGFFGRLRAAREEAAADAAAAASAAAAAEAAAAAAAEADAAAEEPAEAEEPEQQICPICGSAIQPEYTFCIICGHSLTEPVPEPQAPAAETAVPVSDAAETAEVTAEAGEDPAGTAPAGPDGDPDAIAAYQASTANSFAAAAAKGLWQESEEAKSVLFDHSAAQNEEATAEAAEEPAEAEEETDAEEEGESVEELLLRLHALEERVQEQAKAAGNNNEE